MTNRFFDTIFEESMRCSREFAASHNSQLHDAADALVNCLVSGHKILLFGNGGSAADAQHIAGEFVNRLTFNRGALAAIALTTDSSVLTCIANDFEFDSIFSRQIEALGQPGDLAWGISTSGNSENVYRGLSLAKEKSMSTIASLGNKGGKIAEVVDIPLIVDSPLAQRVQEVHIIFAHALCQWVEEKLFL